MPNVGRGLFEVERLAVVDGNILAGRFRSRQSRLGEAVVRAAARLRVLLLHNVAQNVLDPLPGHRLPVIEAVLLRHLIRQFAASRFAQIPLSLQTQLLPWLTRQFHSTKFPPNPS